MSPRCRSDRTWEAVDWTLETRSSSENGLSGIKSLAAILWSSSYWSTLIRRNAMLVLNLTHATQVHLRRSLVQPLFVGAFLVSRHRHSAVKLRIPWSRSRLSPQVASPLTTISQAETPSRTEWRSWTLKSLQRSGGGFVSL